MLNTLIKHEWNYIWKKMVLLLLITVAATLLGAFSLIGIDNLNSSRDTGKVILVIIGLVSYYGVLMCVNFGYLILTGVRFYKNMYGDEAYITHTLPVTPRQLHLSKVIVYSICTMVIEVMVAASIMTFVMIALNKAVPESALELTSEFLGISGAGMIVMLIVMTIVSGISNITCIFGSIVLGQYWKKHKVVGAIVWYVIMTFITSILGSLCTVPVVNASENAAVKPDALGVHVTVGSSSLMMQTFLIATVVCAVIGGACYLIADHGICKKLNLE